jgi:PHD/YefM family antitoxin component YafN of YafNO toxin-antitoxin module
MPTIRPLSDLQSHTDEILKLCLREEQPVFLTQNGHGRLVVMSQNYFEKVQAMARLYAKLDEAEKLSESGDKGISHKEMMRRVRARLKRKAR